MRVVYGDGVFEELVGLSFYIAADNEPAAQRFLDACDETFQFLAGNPLVGSLKRFTSTKLSDVRMWRVKGYEKYLVFYQPNESGVKILHVLHSARDHNRVFEDE